MALLDGATFANAMRRSGKPARIHLPDDSQARSALVAAHLRGEPATLTFNAEGREPWEERVEAVSLAAFCPAADGRCRWLGIDLDGADHGDSGLVDPVHAARTITERASAAGLGSGLLVVRSRRSRGRHVFLFLPKPVELADAVIGVAGLAANAFKAATSDVTEYGAKHSFRCANGAIARLGDSGTVELIPRSTTKLPYGWALALPGAGAFAAKGGGVIVDPFTDQPVYHECVPRCDDTAWSQFLIEARSSLTRTRPAPIPARAQRVSHDIGPRDPLDHVDARTRAFLEGNIATGRNTAAFAAAANLLGCGMDAHEAQRLILAGAAACGLPEREARATFASAVATLRRKQVRD